VQVRTRTICFPGSAVNKFPYTTGCKPRQPPQFWANNGFVHFNQIQIFVTKNFGRVCGECGPSCVEPYSSAGAVVTAHSVAIADAVEPGRIQ